MNPESFTLHEVTAGIWEAEGDFAKPSIGNAAIIDAGGKTIVVDTFMTALAARELRHTAQELTGNAVHLAVNSHWHGDHTNGNQVFSDIPIVSTQGTLDQIKATAPQDIAAWQEEIAQSIESLKAAAAEGDKTAAGRIELLTSFHSFAGEFELTLPNLLIEDRLLIEGERSVEITTFGRGHTVSDVVAWVPEAGVIVTGDLCWAGIHPRMNDGFPNEWAEYVETLIEMSPKHVIPGHGQPGDISLLSSLPSYFRQIPEMVEAVAAGTDPAEIDPPTDTADWAGTERFRASLAALAAL